MSKTTASLLLLTAMALACVSQPEPWVPGQDGVAGNDARQAEEVARGGDAAGPHDVAGIAEDLSGLDDAPDLPGDGLAEDQETEDKKDVHLPGEVALPDEEVPQELQVVWEEEFGAPNGNDSIGDIIRSYNGDFIACGYSNLTQTTGGEELTVRRYKKGGEFLWETKVEKPGQQWCQSLVEMPTGDILVTGLNTGVVRFDFSGKKTWAKDDWYGANGSNLNQIMLTKNGDVVVVGYVPKGGTYTNIQGVIARLSLDGTVLWDEEIGDVATSHEERLSAVVELPNGDILAAGYRSNPQDGKDTLLVGFTATGEKQFELAFERELGNWIGHLVHSGNGYLYLLGGVNEKVVSNHTEGEVWLAKMAYGGSVVWEKSFAVGKANTGLRLAHRLDGGLLLATATGTEPTAQKDCRILATDDDGDVEWEFFFATEKSEFCRAILPLAGDGFVAGGNRNPAQGASVGWIVGVGWVAQ